MNSSSSTLSPGLYVIPPATLTGRALLDAAAAALAGGAVCLQYRAKSQADAAAARALKALCRRRGARFIVNDDVPLALEVDADGVHLGRDDGDPLAARACLGPDRIIGVSCYNDLDRARRLAGQGADYLAFGSVAASPTKPGAVRCPPGVLGRARALGLPVVAIGGITLELAPALVAAGADLLAVISDVFEADDVEARTRAYRELIAGACPGR